MPLPHRDHPLCLCHDCANPPNVFKYGTKLALREDCDDCYMTWNPIMGDFSEMFCDTHAPPPAPPKRDPRAADPDTQYAFTLTMPPTYESKKPIEECARLLLEHGLTNKPYEKPVEWAFVKEHTEAGTPHIHGVYKTASGRRIAAKYFQRYWPLWDEKVKLGQGHKGGYHQKARHHESYEAYLQKEGVVLKSGPQEPEDTGEAAFNPDLISHA